MRADQLLLFHCLAAKSIKKNQYLSTSSSQNICLNTFIFLHLQHVAKVNSSDCDDTVHRFKVGENSLCGSEQQKWKYHYWFIVFICPLKKDNWQLVLTGFTLKLWKWYWSGCLPQKSANNHHCPDPMIPLDQWSSTGLASGPTNLAYLNKLCRSSVVWNDWLCNPVLGRDPPVENHCFRLFEIAVVIVKYLLKCSKSSKQLVHETLQEKVF